MRQSAVDISTLSAKALGTSSAIGYAIKIGALQPYLPIPVEPFSVKATPAPLGRTLAAATPGKRPTSIGTASSGVVEFYFPGDDLPHFRCPPGTRRAGRWTDRLGADCNLGPARQVLSRIGDRMNRFALGEQARGDRPTLGRRWDDVGRRAAWRALQREYNLPREQRDRIDARRAARGIPNPRNIYLNPDGTPYQGAPANRTGRTPQPGAARRRGLLRRWASIWDRNDPENDRQPDSFRPGGPNDPTPVDPTPVDPTVDPGEGLPQWMRDLAEIVDEGVPDNDRRPESLNPNQPGPAVDPTIPNTPDDLAAEEQAILDALVVDDKPDAYVQLVNQARSRKRLEKLREKYARRLRRIEKSIGDANADAIQWRDGWRGKFGRRGAKILEAERPKLEEALARIDERLADEFAREPLRRPDRPNVPNVDRPNTEFANTAQRPRRRPVDRTDRRPATARMPDRTRDIVDATPPVDETRPGPRATEAIDQVSTARGARNRRAFVPDRYGPEFLDLDAGLDAAQQASLNHPDQTLVLLKGRDGKYRIADRRMDWDTTKHDVMAFYDAGVRKPISEYDIIDKIGDDYATVEDAIDVAQQARRDMPNKRIVVAQGRDGKYRVVEDGLFSPDRNEVVFIAEPEATPTTPRPSEPNPPDVTPATPIVPSAREVSPVDSMAERAAFDDRQIQQVLETIDTWDDPAQIPGMLNEYRREQIKLIARRDAIEELLRQGLLPQQVDGALGERSGDFRNRAAAQRYLERLDARINAYDEIQTAGFRRLRELQARPPIASTPSDVDVVEAVLDVTSGEPLSETELATVIRAVDGMQQGTIGTGYRTYGAEFGRQMVARHNANIPEGLDPEDPLGRVLDPNNIEDQMSAIVGHAFGEYGLDMDWDVLGRPIIRWGPGMLPRQRDVDTIRADEAAGLVPAGRISERRAWEMIEAPDLLARRLRQIERDQTVMLLRQTHYEMLASRDGDAAAAFEAVRTERAVQLAEDDMTILRSIIAARGPVFDEIHDRRVVWPGLQRDELVEKRQNIQFVLDQHKLALLSMEQRIAEIQRDFPIDNPQGADAIADLDAIRRYHEAQVARRAMDVDVLSRLLEERGPETEESIAADVAKLKRQAEGVRLLASGLYDAGDTRQADDLVARWREQLGEISKRADNADYKAQVGQLRVEAAAFYSDGFTPGANRSVRQSARLRQYEDVLDKHLNIAEDDATVDDLRALDDDLRVLRALADQHREDVGGALDRNEELDDAAVDRARQYANIVGVINRLEQTRAKWSTSLDERGLLDALERRDEAPEWLRNMDIVNLGQLLALLRPRERNGQRQIAERPIPEDFGGSLERAGRGFEIQDLADLSDEEAWTSTRLMLLHDQVLAEFRIRQMDAMDAEHRDELDRIATNNIAILDGKLANIDVQIADLDKEIQQLEANRAIPNRRDMLWRAKHERELAQSLRDAMTRRREVLRRQEQEEEARFLAASVIPDDPDFRPQDLPHADLASLYRSARDRHEEAANRLATMLERGADQETLDRQRRVVAEAEHELAIAFNEQQRREYETIARYGFLTDYSRDAIKADLQRKMRLLRASIARERGEGNFQRARDMLALVDMYDEAHKNLEAQRYLPVQWGNAEDAFGDSYQPNDWTPEVLERIRQTLSGSIFDLNRQFRFNNPTEDDAQERRRLMELFPVMTRRQLEAIRDAVDAADWDAEKELAALRSLAAMRGQIEDGLKTGLEPIITPSGKRKLRELRYNGPADEYFYADGVPVDDADVAYIKQMEALHQETEALLNELNDQWLTRLQDQQSELIAQLRFNPPLGLDTGDGDYVAQMLENGNLPGVSQDWIWGDVIADVLDGTRTHNEALAEVRAAQTIYGVEGHLLQASSKMKTLEARRAELQARLRQTPDPTEEQAIRNALRAIEFDLDRTRDLRMRAIEHRNVLQAQPTWERDFDTWFQLLQDEASRPTRKLDEQIDSYHDQLRLNPEAVDLVAIREDAESAYRMAQEISDAVDHAEATGITGDRIDYLKDLRDSLFRRAHEIRDLADEVDLRLARLGGAERIAQRRRWLQEDNPDVLAQLVAETDDAIVESLRNGARPLMEELASARRFPNDIDMRRRVTELEMQLVDHLSLLEDRAALNARVRVLRQRLEESDPFDYNDVKMTQAGGVPIAAQRPAGLGLAGRLEADGTVVIEPVVDPTRVGEEYPQPTPEEISQHVYYLLAGGDLAHIPDYAVLAVLEDSRTDPLFKFARPGGNQGDNRLYMPPEAMGLRGVFVKGEDYGSQAVEMVGAMLSHAMGFGPLPPRVDGHGKLTRGRYPGSDGRFLVFEHVLNHVDIDAVPDVDQIQIREYDGTSIGNAAGIEKGYALGQRIAAMLQGFALDLGDRHDGNTMQVDLGDGRTIVLPVDFAWAGAGYSQGDLEAYIGAWCMFGAEYIDPENGYDLQRIGQQVLNGSISREKALAILGNIEQEVRAAWASIEKFGLDWPEHRAHILDLWSEAGAGSYELDRVKDSLDTIGQIMDIQIGSVSITDVLEVLGITDEIAHVRTMT